MSRPYSVFVRAFGWMPRLPITCVALVQRPRQSGDGLDSKTLGPFWHDRALGEHGAVLRTVERALTALAGRGAHAEVHVNLQSVAGVLRGEYAAGVDVDTVERVRALAADWATFVLTTNRARHPGMENALVAAERFARERHGR